MADAESSSTLSGTGDAATITAAPIPNPNTYSRGYQNIGRLMGCLPEFATYRRFGSFNSLDLLCLQSEIHDLERKLHEASG